MFVTGAVDNVMTECEYVVVDSLVDAFLVHIITSATFGQFLWC